MQFWCEQQFCDTPNARCTWKYSLSVFISHSNWLISLGWLSHTSTITINNTSSDLSTHIVHFSSDNRWQPKYIATNNTNDLHCDRQTQSMYADEISDKTKNKKIHTKSVRFCLIACCSCAAEHSVRGNSAATICECGLCLTKWNLLWKLDIFFCVAAISFTAYDSWIFALESVKRWPGASLNVFLFFFALMVFVCFLTVCETTKIATAISTL